MGFPQAEFITDGHWPWQIYAKSRRMVSDYVMNEYDVRGTRRGKIRGPRRLPIRCDHHFQR